MVTVLKEVDAVVIGMGWTGSILSRELTKAGLNVVGLERGGMRSPREDSLISRRSSRSSRSLAAISSARPVSTGAGGLRISSATTSTRFASPRAAISQISIKRAPPALRD